jgi:hypothetical protein
MQEQSDSGSIEKRWVVRAEDDRDEEQMRGLVPGTTIGTFRPWKLRSHEYPVVINGKSYFQRRPRKDIEND